MQDLRVVNHDIFVRTYDMTNFPNEQQGQATAPPAPEGFVTRADLDRELESQETDDITTDDDGDH